MKEFPIHSDSKKGFRNSVPWEFVEPAREQALRNHDQTLERLAERGGLAANELLQALDGKKLYPLPDDEYAKTELTKRLSLWESQRGNNVQAWW